MRAALLRGIAAVGALGLTSGVLVATPAEAATTNLTILSFNDFHGRIANADPSTVGFCGTIEEQRLAAGAGNTLLFSAGDNIGASLFPSFSQDEIPTIDILNAIQVDAAAVGNHEFDRGFDDLVNRVDPASKFTHLGANVYLKGTTTPALPEYELFTRDGVTVAVIGVAPRTTGSSVNPDGVSTIEFGDPVDAMNRVARQLSDGDPNNGEADVIIASYHEGAPVDGSASLQQAKDSAVLFQRLQNPGGTRADWDQGVLTYGEAAAVLPFANTLVTTTLTGAQFKQVLEEQWQPDGASRPFLHLALSDNVQFTYDAERARNDRITSVIVDGEPLDPEAEYVIGTMSFLAAGGDRLFTLAEGTDVVDLGLLDMQELVEYVKAQSDPSGAPAISPDYRKRAVEVFEVGADKSAPVAPTTVTRCEVGPSLQVNQLDFSSIPSVANEELVATIDGFEIGRATVIDGSATIELDGTELTAEHTGTVLTLTAQPTGTVVQVPVTITGDACPTGGPGAPGDDEPGDDDPRDDDAERTDPPARPRGLPDTGR